jgi:heme oxygenase
MFETLSDTQLNQEIERMSQVCDPCISESNYLKALLTQKLSRETASRVQAMVQSTNEELVGR